MWAQLSGGEVDRIITHPEILKIGGVTYPRQTFTDAKKLKSLNILPYREDLVDNRYYDNGVVTYEVKEDEVYGKYTDPQPKDFILIKENMIEKTKHCVSSLLSRDDWMAIRASEYGKSMPEKYTVYRKGLREESNNKVKEINALSDLDEVIWYENTPYIEVRKVEHYAKITEKTTYGPDTEEKEIDIDQVYHYTSVDPLAEVDESFVSLTKK